MPKFSIFNARSAIVENDQTANQTFYAFCRAVWDNLGGGTGKLPELEVSGKVGFFGKNAQEQAEKIEAPVGGSVVDAEARAAIVQIAQVLEHFGLTKEK